MRVVKHDRVVKDVSGLFFDLVQAEFEVMSVSVHDKCTFIHLEDEEEKDPLPFAEDWHAKPEAFPSIAVMQERKRVYDKFKKEKPLRMQNLKARYRVSQELKAMKGAGEPVSVSEMDLTPEVLALPQAARESWIKKLIKFW